MQLEAKGYLHDIQQACRRLADFTSGKSFSDYDNDALLRSAVERQFEIVGEALNGLSEVAPDVAAQIHEYRRIIAFRNRLIHGYSTIDNGIVWDIVQFDLPALSRTVTSLLDKE